jgi:hypothetical protein
MAEIVYNRGKTRILAGDTPLDSADLRMLIIVTSKTGADEPDLDTVADLDAVGTVAIHSERVALAAESVTQDDTNNRANADATTPVVFAAAPGVSALAAVIYDEGGGTDATRHLVSFHDTNFPKAMDGGLNVNIPTEWLRGQ